MDSATHQLTPTERLSAAVTPAGQHSAAGGGGVLAFFLVLWLNRRGYNINAEMATVLGSGMATVAAYLHRVFGILIKKLEQ